MMFLTYMIVFILLLLMELSYLYIADKFGFVDKPKRLSSHTRPTLNGGGIIFVIGVFLWGTMTPSVYQYLPFLVGLIIIAGVSFMDDIKSLPIALRLFVQFASTILMFYTLGICEWDNLWLILLSLVVCVGIINAYNFMDGINGITGAYSLAVLIPLLLIQEQDSIDSKLIITTILADLIFLFFNFRLKDKAKCFAGDVGSISMAFIIIYLLGKVMFATGDMTYLIFLIVYGVDSFLTIVHRILLRENIFRTHKKNAFHIMANELGISHLRVSSFYTILQLLISLIFLYMIPNTNVCHWMYLICVLLILVVAYVLFMKKYYKLHDAWLSQQVNKENENIT